MSNNCKRCGGKFTGKKYNPYNITFKCYNFGEKEDGRFCLKCANYFVKYHNQCKGGVWTLENTLENQKA